LALSAEDLPFVGDYVRSIVGFSSLLTEPFIAFVYLAVPYLFMVVVDLYSRSRRRKAKDEKEDLEGLRDFIESRTGENAPP